MAYDNAEQLEEFRLETRKWLEANCPPSMRTPMPDDEVVWGGRNAVFKNPESKLWLDRMGEKGWTSPESYTHGTSAQRVKAFTAGYKTGDLTKLDSFFEARCSGDL